RIVRRVALRLPDVLGPLGVVADRIDAEPDDLGAPLVEFGLETRHVPELGGAHGCEILRVREEHRPGVADPVVETNASVRRVRFEIRSGTADLKGHGPPPRCEPPDRPRSRATSGGTQSKTIEIP